MTTAEKVWTRQHNRLADQIEQTGAIVTFDDGTQGIMPGIAPAAVEQAFTRSMQVGFAKGWL